MASSKTEIDAAIDDVETRLGSNNFLNYLLPTTTGPGVHADAIGFAERITQVRIALGTARTAACPFEETTFVDV